MLIHLKFLLSNDLIFMKPQIQDYFHCKKAKKPVFQKKKGDIQKSSHTTVPTRGKNAYEINNVFVI